MFVKTEDDIKNEVEEAVSDDLAAEEEEEPIVPARQPESAKKRRIKRIVFYVSAMVIALIICSLLSLTVFFKIDEIYVEGTTKYTESEIIAASMIKKNDNLILCNTAPGKKNIVEKFPYVDDVDIQKRLFNKINIKITEAKPVSMIKSGDKYYVLSKKSKIIEIDSDKKYNIPVIVGAKLKNTKLCGYAEYEDQDTKKYLDEVISLIRKYEIKGISTIDISSLSNIFMLKSNGFKIVIGSPANLDYKFNSASSIINEHVSDNDTGILDVSVVDEDGARSFFKTKEESKPESSKPQEKSKPESSQPESSLEESSEPSEEVSEESENTEYPEDEESNEEYSEDEDEGEEEESFEDEEEYSEEEYDDESYEDEEYENEPSEDEEDYSEDDEEDENEYSEEEYYDDDEENNDDDDTE